MENGHWAVRLGECERCQITHRDPETVTASAGRAPAGQSSNTVPMLECPKPEPHYQAPPVPIKTETAGDESLVPAEGRLSDPAGVGKNDHVRHR